MVDEAITSVIPLHRWTHTGDQVLILKCVDKDNRSYQGFDYPRQPDGGPHGLGPVAPAKWSRELDCESGGIFGWAWGLAFGDGKQPDYQGIWKVIAAHPDDVIDVLDHGVSGGKVKAVPNPELGRCPEVVFSGTLAKAIQLILEGQIAWIKQASKGSAASSGDRSSAASSGYSSSAASSGDSSSAASSGCRSSAASSGDRSSAASSGYSSSAASSGDSSSAASSGCRSSAASSGDRSIAAISGEFSQVSAWRNGIAASTADDCWWLVHEDALFVQCWEGGHRCVTAAEIGAQTGDRVRFVKGAITEHIRKEAS